MAVTCYRQFEVRPLLILLALSHALCGQNAFDVASVKPSPPPAGDLININLGSARNGEVTLGNARLADCIKFAWTLASDAQLAGPDWIKDKAIRFDVVAKAPRATPRDSLLLMLRQLLKERFQLTMHTQQRKIPHYVLGLAKTGSKLHEVEPPQTATLSSRGMGLIQNPAMPMQTLALLLSRQTGDMVLDRTGLNGFYEVKLEWTPENSATETGPSLFTAVREQLGLQLENRKDPVNVYVVDSALKSPVAN
jgi:uncharacterized protein (TIGR03435 family)